MSTQPFFPGLEPSPQPVVAPPAPRPPAPKNGPVPRRDMTPDECAAVRCLKQQVTYPPATWDKRFARELLDTQITAKQVGQVWRLFHKYRRQITHPDKTRLLELADTLAAPDLRKQSSADEARRRIEGMNAQIQP